jgi:hypothetical protein
MLTLATEEEQAFRRSSQQDLVLEVLLVRLALLDRTVDLDRALETLGAGGGGGRPAPEPRKVAPRPRAPAAETSPVRGGNKEGGKAGGPLTLESLLAAWDEVVEEIHASRPTVAASLKEARPSDCREDGVTLTLPLAAEFKLEQLSGRGMLDPLAGVLARRWGFNGRIRVEPVGDHAPGSVPPEAAAPVASPRPTGREIEAGAIDARLKGDPLLRQVVDLFDASVVKVRPSS